MELAFIWIKKYGPINKLGINFNNSSNSFFEYNGQKLQITSKENNKLCFGDNITGISIIAGQNGAGKTSLCEAVLYSTATIQEGIFGYDLPFDGIVCYGNYIFYHQNLIVRNIEELQSLGYTVTSFEKSPFEDIKLGLKKEFSSGGFIYYSNNFDFSTAFQGVNLVNISSANCLFESSRYSSYPLSHVKKDQVSSVYKYRVLEVNSIIEFITGDTIKPPFDYPKSFVLLSSYSGNNRFISEDETNRFYSEFEDEIFSKLCNRYYSIDQRNLRLTFDWVTVKNLIHQLYRLNILRLILDGDGISADQVREIIFEDRGPAILTHLNKSTKIKISALFKFHKNILDNSREYEIDKFNPYSIYTMYNDNVRDWRFILMEKLYFEPNENNREYVRGLLNLEKELLNNDSPGIKKISNFLMVNFYSSGELSYLSLFSRLNDVIKNYSSGHYKKKTVILFIDEGDVGFHPSWSKKFLKWLIDFLNNRNEGLKFQLIFSTHSPYLLSDVHNENLILLKREYGSNTEIVDSSKFLTFGANIYDLLADGFFLNDGAIGDFAKDKINFAIQKINQWLDLKKDGLDGNNTDLISDYNNEVFDIINLVGDNIVRNKLNELYFQIFEDNSPINKEIEYLEARLRILKGGRI